MKELKSILSLYDSYKSRGEKCAIAQVVRVEESSYRREGARMLVFESGVFEGGISGGCLEGDALKRSQMAIYKQKPSVVTYDTSKDDENQIGVGLGCNGVIDVLICPLDEQEKTLSLLRKCAGERKSHLLITVIESDGTNENINLGDVFYADTDTQNVEDCSSEILKDFIEGQLKGVIEKKKSKIANYQASNASFKVFIEYLPASYHLAIFGDNYDVYPMVQLAEVMDWQVSLVGKISKLKAGKIRSVDQFFSKEEEQRPAIDDRTAVILMAHDYATDINNLKVYLDSPSPYIASLGPKKRFEKMLRDFEKEGMALTSAQMDKIYAPCGLELGANTPEEIAASIFAEIIAVFSDKEGGMLRNKKSPIHDRE